MTDKTFSFSPRRVTPHSTGLTYNGAYKSRDDMVKIAEQFEGDVAMPYHGKWAKRLAAECRQAIAEHDAYFAENEDEELRWQTETEAA